MNSDKQLAFLGWLFEDDIQKSSGNETLKKEDKESGAAETQKKAIAASEIEKKKQEPETESIIKKLFSQETTQVKEIKVEKSSKLPASGMGDYVLVLSIFLSLGIVLGVRCFSVLLGKVDK